MYSLVAVDQGGYPHPRRPPGDVIHTILFGSIFEQWSSAETKLRYITGTHRPWIR
jgi:hypothetical protein